MLLFRNGIALLLCVVLSACDTGEPEQPPVQSSRPQARDEASIQTLVKPVTDVQVMVRNGRVSITATDAPQLALLAQLAKQAGFGLDLFHRDWSSVTLSLNEVSLEKALSYILAGTSYEVFYRPGSGSQSPMIDRVRIGKAPNDEEYRAKALAIANSKHFNATPSLNLDVSMDQLLALNDQEKIEVLAHLPPSANNLPLLLDFMKNDSDAEVRISAMAALENANSPEALDAIVEVLGDPDPKMVLAAIDSIEFAGGVEQIFALEPLLQHTSPSIRRAASEAIDFLR
nr:HEAT repeat domain-containing protein [uncultured Pseudomonas sp.]